MALDLYIHKQNKLQSENLVVLIHGLGASDSTWNQNGVSWIDLFLSDEKFESLDVAEVTYDTAHLASGVLSLMGVEKLKIGKFKKFTVGKGSYTTLEILARELKREIDSNKMNHYKNIVLLGHSMGGLVAIRYILEEYENNQPQNVKGLISLATPYNGSSYALYNKLVKSINEHAQIPSLEPNSAFLDETIRLWQKYLGEMEIDFKFFFGTQDNIVPENTAIPHVVSSKWTGGVPLPGDHSGILEIKDHSSTGYIHVSEALQKILEKKNEIKKKMINEQKRIIMATLKTRFKASGLEREKAIHLIEKKQRDFEYLKPTKEKRLVLIVGEFGLGKSFAIDMIYLNLLSKAESDFDFPIPQKLNAAQLDTDVQGYLEGIVVDDSKEFWIILDGMDEVSVSIASNILENMRIAVERWSNLRVILTSRPQSFLINIPEVVKMEGLNEEESLELVNFVSDKENIHNFYNLTVDIKEVIQRPLFAILLGLYLNNRNNLIPNTSGELLSFFIESALEKVEISDKDTKKLFMNLGMKSTCQGNIPIKKTEIGDLDEIRDLLNSGIIMEEDGYLSFVLPILNQWFTAKALSENMINIQEIIDRGILDYWKYPLVILVTLFKENQIDGILNKIVEKNPGFAAVLIEESISRWGIHTNATSLSEHDCGEKIRMTMNSWVKSLGDLAYIIAPVDKNGNLLPIGVKKDDEWLTTSWYKGAKDVSKVNVLDPKSRNALAWPSWKGARPGDKSSWYWRWTLEELRESLKNQIENQSLPICTDIVFKELMWSTTLKIVNIGNLYTGEIEIDYIKSKLKKAYQSISYINVGNKNVPLSMYNDYIADLESRGISVVRCPLPGEDITHPDGHWVWSAYSNEQLYLRTLEIYKEAICGYKELVETYFPLLKFRLRKYVLYPFILKGELELPEKNGQFPMGPGLKWHIEPLPFEDTEHILDIKVKKERSGFDDESLYTITKKIKEYRPDDFAWLSANQTSQILHIFGDTPVTDLIYKWLKDDLDFIKWLS